MKRIDIYNPLMLSAYTDKQGVSSRWFGLLKLAGSVDPDVMADLLKGKAVDGTVIQQKEDAPLAVILSLVSPVGYAKYPFLHTGILEIVADYIQENMAYVESEYMPDGKDFGVGIAIAVYTYKDNKSNCMLSNFVIPMICKHKYAGWMPLELDFGHDNSKLEALYHLYSIRLAKISD